MNKSAGVKIAVLFSLIGVLFSGYLTFAKLVLGTCPLTEPCAYFLGQPTCMFGFVFFIILFIASVLLMFKKYNEIKLIKVLTYISLIAIIFSFYFSYVDLFLTACPGGCKFSMLLPTCVYGLVFYIIVFAASYKMKK
ncbi:MAG: hypothetical protein NT120_02000 [Candidatus Aenigmarchaeota archaeon]|nr:hypothetical protein [Candidatus Aenigmarchaeota archaeon]